MILQSTLTYTYTSTYAPTSILDLCWRRWVDWYRESSMLWAVTCLRGRSRGPTSQRPKVPTPDPTDLKPENSFKQTKQLKKTKILKKPRENVKKVNRVAKWEEERGEQRHRRSEYTEEIEEIIILKKLLLSHFYRSNQIITLNGPIVAKQFQWQKLLSCIGLSLISSSRCHPYTPNLRSITPSTNLCKHAIDIRIRCLL